MASSCSIPHLHFQLWLQGHSGLVALVIGPFCTSARGLFYALSGLPSLDDSPCGVESPPASLCDLGKVALNQLDPT